MRIKRVYAIAEKEVFHIVRDPFTLGLALLLPMMMVVIFALAMEFNVKEIPIAVYDGDHTLASRQLIEILGSSHYFLPRKVESQKQAIEWIDAERFRAALILEPQFERKLFSGRQASSQVLLDGSDNSTIGSVISYMNSLQTLASEKIVGSVIRSPVQLKTRFLYNPELNSRWFSVPGLMVVILGILSILLTALTVSREWENGSMELLLSTPVEPLEIILGKLSPYVVLGLGAVTAVYFVARTFLNVPFCGSHWVFLLGCLLFLITYLSQGLLISVLVRKQQLAMQFSLMSGFLPAMLLSGFIFPVESMPLFFRIFTSLLPARWFMVISRDVFLKGSGILDLYRPFFALAIIASIMVTLAVKKFKRDVEP